MPNTHDDDNDVISLAKLYTVRRTQVPTKPGCWNKQLFEILRSEEKIGEYEYDYSSGSPFYPFRQDGKDYALYSRSYTATRVMLLPECKDLGGEEPHGNGFCPVEYYVPPFSPEMGLVGKFGFVAGCVWGDDTSWKIQFLDLSRVAEGVIVRTAKFGYIELPASVSLKDAIDVGVYDPEDDCPFVRIVCAQMFDLRKDVSEKS